MLSSDDDDDHGVGRTSRQTRTSAADRAEFDMQSLLDKELMDMREDELSIGDESNNDDDDDVEPARHYNYADHDNNSNQSIVVVDGIAPRSPPRSARIVRRSSLMNARLAASAAADDEELRLLIAYQPRCTFATTMERMRNGSSNGVRPTSSSNANGSISARRIVNDDANVASHSSIVAASSSPVPILSSRGRTPRSFHIDGIEMHADGGIHSARRRRDASGDNHTSSTTSTLASSSSLSSLSRPSTGSSSARKRHQQSSSSIEEKTSSTAMSSSSSNRTIRSIPPSPLHSHRGSHIDDAASTDAFIRSFQSHVLDLQGLISSAPVASAQQQTLVAAGVIDMASWGRNQRAQFAKEAREDAHAYEQMQASQQMKRGEQAAKDERANSRRPDAKGMLNEEVDAADDNANNSSLPTLLPPLLPSSSPSPRPIASSSPIVPSLLSPSVLPPLLSAPPSSASAAALRSSLAVEASAALHLARDNTHAQFALAESQRKAAALIATKLAEQHAKDVEMKEAAYRAAEEAQWSRKEEKRLREIKLTKAKREKDAAEREAIGVRDAALQVERLALARENSRIAAVDERLRTEVASAARAVALQARRREVAAMMIEDTRSDTIARATRARHAADSAERARIEQLRMDAQKAANDESTRLAQEYSRAKREEARVRIEAEEIEARRLEQIAREKRRIELELAQMKADALRAMVEAERVATLERLAKEAAVAEALAKVERERLAALAIVLARLAAEESERLAAAEAVRRAKEEADRKSEALRRAELARIEREQIEHEKRLATEAAAAARRARIDLARRVAATKIQSLFRARRVRRNHPASRALIQRRARRNASATSIQALIRGWVLRRKLARIRSGAKFQSDKGLDDDDEFDYGGVDPSFYVIDSIPEFDMKLPKEAEMMLRNAAIRAAGGVATGAGVEKKATIIPIHQQYTPPATNARASASSIPASIPSALPRSQPGATSSSDAHPRVHSAGSSHSSSAAAAAIALATAASLSSYGRGGMLSSSVSSPAQPPQRVNNFFGATNNQSQIATKQTTQQQPSVSSSQQRASTFTSTSESTKFPRITPPSSASSDLSSSTNLDSHRSADHSSRPALAPAHAPGSGSSKSAQVAALSAAWGVLDPRTLDSMMRKRSKLARMKSAAAAHNTTADERYEKFQRVAGTMGQARTNHPGGANGAGAGSGAAGKRKKKRGGVPNAWAAGAKTAELGSADDDDQASDDYDDNDDDDRTSTASHQYRSTSSSNSHHAPSPLLAPLSPSLSSTSSFSSRSIGSSAAPIASAAASWMQMSNTKVGGITKKR